MSTVSGMSHYLYSTTTIENCVSNFTIIDSEDYRTTGYSVSANLGGSCTSSNFITTLYDG